MTSRRHRKEQVCSGTSFQCSFATGSLAGASAAGSDEAQTLGAQCNERCIQGCDQDCIHDCTRTESEDSQTASRRDREDRLTASRRDRRDRHTASRSDRRDRHTASRSDHEDSHTANGWNREYSHTASRRDHGNRHTASKRDREDRHTASRRDCEVSHRASWKDRHTSSRKDREDSHTASGRDHDSHKAFRHHYRSLSDSHELNRSRPLHHYNKYSSQLYLFQESRSFTDRGKRSRSKKQSCASKKSLSPFNRRERSKSRSQCFESRSRNSPHWRKASVSPSSKQERSQSQHYQSRKSSEFSFSRPKRSESSSQHFHRKVSPSKRRESLRCKSGHCYCRKSVPPSNRRKRSGSRRAYESSRNMPSCSIREGSRHRNQDRYSSRSMSPSRSSRNKRRSAMFNRKITSHWKRWSALKRIAVNRSPGTISDSLESTENGLRNVKGNAKSVDSSGTANSQAAGLPWKHCQHSVARLLLSSHQRGEMNQSRMHTTWVLSTASSLQRIESRKVSVAPQAYENLEHMTHMQAHKDQSRLLCMWSIPGTALQQIQVLGIKTRPRVRCGDLGLDFTLSDLVLQSWYDITSLCWADIADCSAVLYTTYSRSRTKTSAANLCFMDASMCRSQSVDYLLGCSYVWTCAWNASKVLLGAGLDQQCQVIDPFTRQFWTFSSHHGKVLALIFSKTDTGQLVYSGLSGGIVQMYDMRRKGKKATVVIGGGCNHGICDLKLSPDERHLYTSDISGQIKKWDLRMHKRTPVMTYVGLHNNHCRLRFHIDDTHTILYAAGTDSQTKIWSLQSGELLQTIMPPYPLGAYRLPAVQLSTSWGGTSGNMGLIMGTHQDLHLYASAV